MNCLVRLRDVSVRVGLRVILHPLSLEVRAGEIWAVVGGNGSGKTVLSEIVAGTRAPTRGSREYGPDMEPGMSIQVLSFEAQLQLIERERHDDLSSIMHGATDPGTTVETYVRGGSRVSPAEIDRILDEFRIRHVSGRGLRLLSTGEIRKVILCRALARAPKLLILDDPYDGLDQSARKELEETVNRLPERGTTVVLVLARDSEMSAAVTNIAAMRDSRLHFCGRPADYSRLTESVSLDAAALSETPPPGVLLPGNGPGDRTLVQMRNVNVSYGETAVLRDINWTACAGESWHIVGPNGAGKTTLLSLVTGSNPKAYNQEITLFGRRRGSGESVWDIKKEIGLVSGDFHNGYPRQTRVLDAVLSGYEDSAGLYREESGFRIEMANAWLALIGLRDKARARLSELSYGQQRSVLIARAMVKAPPLLVADEPCQGLDGEHSNLVLSLLDRIATQTATCLLYVSHNPEHGLRSTTCRLILNPGPHGSTAVVERESS